MTRRKTPGIPEADAALWERAMEDVRPLDRPKRARHDPPRTVLARVNSQKVRLDDFSASKDPVNLQATPLDTRWQKQLRRGRMDVDRSIDLHGMTQTAAHRLLLKTLGEAIAQDLRILLVVTGKGAPKTAQGEGRQTGVLRRMLPQWVEGSSYAGQVLAVRPAHPIHGGAGAYYILLRRKRGS